MVAQSLPCPAYSGGGSKGGKVPGRREGSGEAGTGDVLVGRRHCKKVFQLLVLVPQAEIRGQQTQGSLERVPLLPAPPPPSSVWLGPGMTLWAAWPSPWPGFPFSILKFPSPCHQFLCVAQEGKAANSFLKLQVAEFLLRQSVPLAGGQDGSGGTSVSFSSGSSLSSPRYGT